MSWSRERKRFVGAMALFLVWVAVLTGLAVVSSRSPSARSEPLVEPTSSARPAPEAVEK